VVRADAAGPGIVVRDIEKAMRHWAEVCGVGPWFYTEQLPMDEFRYKGRIYDLNCDPS
jgi:hypothetical protein